MFSRTLRNTALFAVVGLALMVSPATASFRFSIVIPRIHLNAPLSYTTRDYGPAIYYQDKDTLGIAGHRVTHTHPFYYIDQMRRGDRIYIHYKNYTNRYIVTRIYPQVLPTSLRQFESFKGLILSACTPRHFATYRYVILAKPA